MERPLLGFFFCLERKREKELIEKEMRGDNWRIVSTLDEEAPAWILSSPREKKKKSIERG